MAIKKVLVVDDSPTERFVMTELLKKHGYHVLVADTGEDGIAKVKTEHPDLVIMDVIMPGTNGFQATRNLKRDDGAKNIPVIICTSKSQETDKIWGLRQGADNYLTKPVKERELLAAIAALE
ncbi:MAG: response regulator [Zoogloeaceae bacterium]|jgi:twitching motility two-component system response regulator PilH|nr:response regulator [Zoogloeaceae bacterium]